MQQPKPADAYDLDMAALGFSSTQMLEGDLAPDHTAMIFAQALQTFRQFAMFWLTSVFR